MENYSLSLRDITDRSERLKIIDGEEIRVSETRYYDIPDANKYSSFLFIYRSTLNRDVVFRLRGEGSQYFEVFNGEEYITNLATLKNSGTRKRLLNTEKIFLSSIASDKLEVALSATSAPTSGEFWLEVIGIKK